MKEQRFEDLPVGTRRAYRLDGDRVIIKVNAGGTDNALEMVHGGFAIVTIQPDHLVKYYEGTIGIKQH